MKASPKARPAAATKLDLLKLHKADYVAPAKPVLLDIKPAQYLVIDGRGHPDQPLFEARVGALFAMAFTLKMSRKFSGGEDYAVSKLECIYDNLHEAAKPEDWRWKLIIRTPDFITDRDLAEALAALKKRGKEGDAALVKLESIHEGRCVQVLHTGPYDKESETVALMRAFAEKQGIKLQGRFHEIYISDPRRVEAAKLKTILRLPE